MARSLPFYLKLTLIILLVWLLLYGFYLGQQIFLPIGFAFLFAILLRPVERRLSKWKVPKVISILLSLLGAIVLVVGVLTLISTQMSSFVSDIPTVQGNLEKLWHNLQGWVSHTFNVSQSQQQQLLNKAKTDTMNGMGGRITSTLGVITSSVASLVLVPIYVFLFMYYRELLTNFIRSVFDAKHSAKVEEILGEISSVVQHYIVGLLTETACVAALNAIGLLLLGVPYAVLLGIIGAILNLIPYIGGVIAIFLTALLAYTNTGEISKLVGAVVIYLVVQFIDNNFFVPRLIGSKVKLNALISILSVLIGGAICGIGGMFLSIPAIAICKVIFDRVDDLKPWGMLLGDDQTTWQPITLKRRTSKKAIEKNE